MAARLDPGREPPPRRGRRRSGRAAAPAARRGRSANARKSSSWFLCGQQVGRVEQERLAARGRPGQNRPWSTPWWTVRTRAGLEAVALDQLGADVVADRDHDPAVANRRAVDAAAVGELAAGEELRKRLVLEIVDRRRRRRPVEPGQHRAEREVDRVELGRPQRAPEPPRREGGAGEPRGPAEPAPAGGERGDDGRGQAAAGVRRRRGDEDAVLELARARERADELARERQRAAGGLDG